ncbi:hypothetical protein [Nocardia goodfellowii]|uniref:Uncharacterized protein n=1 Tax=Nocardia goodfellowii TaxID=882446 RepID=A0ABS4QRI8_9NOCA|nr:hypothetical protein [Nocardia goodfellowii]MBP2194331.1 hypothetical protein [Nocardia goodfellowii]
MLARLVSTLALTGALAGLFLIFTPHATAAGLPSDAGSATMAGVCEAVPHS